jgi:hypothetical protein
MQKLERHWGRSETLLSIAIMFGLLHHIDHVLRFDHSGWPFRPEVTPFTFSLLAYPLLLVALLWRARPWLRVFCAGFVFIAVQLAHVFIETPAQQFGVWAHNASEEPYAFHHPNLLNLQSPFLGYVAVVLSILLSVALVSATFSLFIDARREKSQSSAHAFGSSGPVI